MLLNCYPGRSDKPDWSNHELIAKNRRPACSNLVPFPDLDTCQSANTNHRRYLSPYVHILNGEWMFKYFDPISMLPEKILSFRSGFDVIQVPACWQDFGYGKTESLGDSWPYPLIPPRISEDQGVGVYRRTCTLPHYWNGLRKHLVFMGVSQAFHIYINQKQVGFAQQSHDTVSFDVTNFWHEGENEILLIVYEASTVSYLEYQHPISAHGIFRDVYLEASPTVALSDLQVHTAYSQSRDRQWQLTLNLRIQSHRISLESPVVNVLLSKNDHILLEESLLIELEQDQNQPDHAVSLLSTGSACVSFTLDAIEPWSSERPILYDLFVSVIDHQGREQSCCHQVVGFRHLQRRGHRIELNGQELQLHTVRYRGGSSNRRRSCDLRQMSKDLRRIREHGFNCIQVIDGPPDPILYDLCDSIGLYAIGESDIECLGALQSVNDSSLRNNWQLHMVDRLERMIRRDFNHPSILAWSPGRRLSDWPELDQLIKHMRRLDSDRVVLIPCNRSDLYQANALIHTLTAGGLNVAMIEMSLYEYLTSSQDSTNLVQFESSDHNENYSELVSTDIPHYYAYLFTAASSATCDLDKWLLAQIDKGSTCFGAGVIQFRHACPALSSKGMNNAYLPGQSNTSEQARRSGWHVRHDCMPALMSDMDDSASDWSSLLQGALKRVLLTFVPSTIDDQLMLRATNKYAYTAVDNLVLDWQLYRKQKGLTQGSFESEPIPPGLCKEFVLPLPEIPDSATHVNARLKWSDPSWLYQTRKMTDLFTSAIPGAFDPSTALGYPAGSFAAISRGSLRMETDRHLLILSGHRFWLIFNRLSNAIESWRCTDTELLDQSPVSQSGLKKETPYWHILVQTSDGLQEKNYRCIPISLQSDCDGQTAVVESRVLLAVNSQPADFELISRYEIGENGMLQLDLALTPLTSQRFFCYDAGLCLFLHRNFNLLQWFGPGPDRSTAAITGRSWLAQHYSEITPTTEEHENCNWLYVHNGQGLGMMLQSDRPFRFRTNSRDERFGNPTSVKNDIRRFNRVELGIALTLDQQGWPKQLLPLDRQQAEIESNHPDGTTESICIHRKSFRLQPLIQK